MKKDTEIFISLVTYYIHIHPLSSQPLPLTANIKSNDFSNQSTVLVANIEREYQYMCVRNVSFLMYILLLESHIHIKSHSPPLSQHRARPNVIVDQGGLLSIIVRILVVTQTPVIVIVALEEGIFPFVNWQKQPAGIHSRRGP